MSAHRDLLRGIFKAVEQAQMGGVSVDAILLELAVHSYAMSSGRGAQPLGIVPPEDKVQRRFEGALCEALGAAERLGLPFDKARATLRWLVYQMDDRAGDAAPTVQGILDARPAGETEGAA